MAKDKTIIIRVTDEERFELERAARIIGVSLTELVRTKLFCPPVVIRTEEEVSLLREKKASPPPSEAVVKATRAVAAMDAPKPAWNAARHAAPGALLKGKK